MQRIISPGLSPNTESDDVLLAIKTLVQPWKWKQGAEIKQVEKWFREEFNTDTAVSFNSGRSALWALLKAFDIGSGDEVLVQAFTCVAVPEVVMWVGAKPVYCDIDNTFNIDPNDIEKKITKKTKAIIVQHTFGIPARIREIREIGKRYNLVILEDCAHALGATVGGKNVGSFGDAAFFSFGRDKVVSSVFGGMAIVNLNSKFKITNSRQAPNIKLQNIQKNIPYPSYFWILQQLLHPILFAIIIPLYNVFSIGKVLLIVFQKLKLLSFPVYPEEKLGEMPEVFPKKYPNALALLVLNQLNKLKRYNEKRVAIAKQYGSIVPGAIYLRYPLLIKNPKVLIDSAKQKGILLGNWYHNVVDPNDCQLSAVGYKHGLCSKAEEIAAQIVNLPTYPRMTTKDVQSVLEILKYPNKQISK